MTSRSRQRAVDTVVACHYAADPVTRPQCTLTATVAFGTIALCPSCQTRRSTLGKGQPPRPLTTEGRLDVLDWISAAHEQTKRAERNLTAAVTRARQTGASWSAIGTQLGTSRQAAQQRFTRASAHESTKPPTRAS